MILTEIKQYRVAYKDFIDWLQNESDVKNVSAYLTLQDRLSIGTIIEYIHSKNVNILLGNHSASLIKGKGYTYFKAAFEHKGLMFIWTFKSERKLPFNIGMNIAIDKFFYELNEQLKVLNK